MPNRKTWVEIDAAALRHNYRSLARLAKSAEMMAVIKANAYGHGLLECAKILKKENVKWFGVDHLDEALALRKAGIKQNILVIGYTPNARLHEALKKDISITVFNLNTLRLLLKMKGKPRVHIPIETGLTREGMSGDELEKAFAFLAQHCDRITLEGVHMHFANIEDTKSRAYADKQISEYDRAIGKLKKYKLYPKLKHTAATAAYILYSDTKLDMVRTGIGLYGLWPSESVRKSQNAKRKIYLEPVLTWKTMVAQVKSVKRGTPVSYGLTERVSRDSKIAVLPIGYADGFDRIANSKRGHVLINGKRCKVLGRVCMNMTMVDVTDAGPVKPEQEAVLIGKHGKERLSAEEVAGLGKTINYEIVTRINWDIPRIVIT